MTRPFSLRTALAVLTVVAVGLAGPAHARAQTVATDIAAAAQGGKKKKKSPIAIKWGDHPSLRIGKALRVDFVGRLQREASYSQAPVDRTGTASLDIARTRVGIEGTVGTFLGYSLEREVNNADPWRSVYLDFTRFKAVQVQGGKFKLPFSLDENTGATNLDFAYRSLIASQLSPGRDKGIMVHGQLAGRLLDYEVGGFQHDGHNATTTNPARMVGGLTGAVRVLVHPFGLTSRFEDLRLGVAATSSRLATVSAPATPDLPATPGGLLEGKSSLKGHTVLGVDMYQADIPIRGRRDRLGFELRWRTGPAAIRAEFIRVAEQRHGEGVDDGDLPAVVYQGWYVSGTWALTGETKSKGLDRPLHPLFGGGVGAVEVAARVEQIAYGAGPNNDAASTSKRSPVVLGNRDLALTFGVNWYPLRVMKIQGNVIREHLADPTTGPLPGQAAFWSRVVRIQIGF
jgi:phosphate-selective porin OprO and OprP